MQRLIDDANAWAKANGKAADLSIESFSDVVTAIDYIQQKQHIAGTTAKEAGSTIAGSFGAMRAAWDNLVTGFSDPKADLGELIGNFVTAASTALENAIPTIVQALGGIATMIEKIAPVIGEKLPELIEQVLPPLLTAATTIVQALADALPDLIEIIMDNLPDVLNKIIPVAIQALTTIVTTIADELPVILTIIDQNIDTIASGIFTVISAIGEMVLEALPQLAEMIVKWLPKAVEYIQKNLSKITSGISKVLSIIGNMLLKLFPVIFPQLVKMAVELIKNFANYISQNASQMVSAILEIARVIVETLLDPNTLITIMNCGLQILLALIQGLADNMDKVMELVFTLVENIIAFFVLGIPDLVAGIGKAGATIVTEVIPKIILSLGEKFGDILDWLIGDEGVLSWIPKMVSACLDVGKSIWTGMWNGISAIWETIIDGGSKVIDWVVSGISNGIGELFNWGVKLGKKVLEGIQSTWGMLKEALNPVNWFKGTSIISDEMKEKMKEAGIAGADGYIEGQEEGYDINSPSKKMDYVGRMVMRGFSNGLEKEADADGVFDKSGKIDMDAIGGVGVESKVGGMADMQNNRINELIALLTRFMDNGQETVIPVYIGGHQIDEILVDGKNRITTRSGGQVNV